MAAALARYTHPSEHSALIERVYRAVDATFASAGADARFGTQLAGALEVAGFEEVGGEVHAPIVSGGTEQWTRASVEQLGEPLIRTGLVNADDVSRFLAVSAERSTHYAPPSIASVWGRRPAK